MANDSSITLPQSAYSIQEAAVLIGKSDQTVRKYIKDGRFPGVEMVAGDKGDEYRIPSIDLGRLIEEKNLVINLDQSNDQSPAVSTEHFAELIEAKESIGHLTGQVENLTSDRERITKERDQARSDLEHERSGHGQTNSQLVESDKAKAVAEARVEELRKQVDQAAQERDSLGQSMRELEESSAESLSALSGDLDGVRSDLENAENDVTALTGERDELAAKAQKLEDSLGWWARRKYNRP